MLRQLLVAAPRLTPRSPAPLLAAAALLLAASAAEAQPARPAQPSGPAAARARPAPAGTARPVPLPAVETWKLPNGLEVAFAALPGSPVVSVQAWYRVGAADDPAGKRGLARLFETLMLSGSARVRPGDHRAYLEQIGGTTSASVSEDISAFASTLPAERLEYALDLEAERMRNLELTDDAVARAVELAQARQAEEGRSGLYRAYRRLVATAFVQHPYGQSAAAPAADLASIGPADARAFYDAYYQPGNALLVVVGGVDQAAVRAAIEARFAAIPAVAEPPRPAAELPEPPQSARRREEVSGADGLVMVGFHIPAARAPSVYAYQLLGQILTGGRSSRLGKLTATGKAIDVGGQVLVRRDPGLMLIYAGGGRGAASEVLEQAIDAELLALARSGPSAAELARAKRQITATVLGAAQSATGYGNQLGMAWSLTGAPGAIGKDLGELAAVPAAAVRKAAADGLKPDQATVIVGGPAQQGGR
jgi:zinc protease